MNQRSLPALIVLNIVLLAALAVTLLSPRAEAQGLGGGGGRYLAIAGNVQARDQQAAVYIVERDSGALAVIMFNTSNKKMEILAFRDVKQDLTRGLINR